MDKVDFVAIGFLIVLVITASVIGGYEYGVKKVRTEAVKAGVATWGFDESGSVAVNWKK